MGGGAATGANGGGNTGNGLEGGEDGDKNGFVFQLPVKIEKKSLGNCLFMCGSCHFNKLSNVELGVQLCIFIYFFVFCYVKKRANFVFCKETHMY